MSLTFVNNQTISHKGWPVPLGFHSDGCSIPRLLRPVFDFIYFLLRDSEDRYKAACIWHDWARRHLVHYQKLTVQQADWLFRNYLRELGMPHWLAQVYWLGVKIFRPWFRRTEPIPTSAWKPYLEQVKK